MVTPSRSSWATSYTCSWPESLTMMSWRRNFIPHLLCDRPADKCFVVWWIEAFSCHQSTKGSSLPLRRPAF